MPAGQVVEPITAYERHVHDVVTVHRAGRTPVQEFAIVELGTYGPALLLDGRVQSTAGDEAHYHEALLYPAYAMSDRVERVLVLGGANGGVLHRLCALPGLRRVVQLDVDGELYEITRSMLPHMHRGADRDPRCRVVFGDPRALVREVREAGDDFDLVVADLPDATEGSATERLFTAEFYAEVRGVLRPGGLFATQAGPAHFLAADFFAGTLRTLGSVFRYATPYAISVPSYGVPWGFVVAGDTVDPAGVTEERVAAAMAKVDPKASTVYDAVTHRHMFALERRLREALADSGTVATDRKPINVVS
ncbi:hypothetical protein ABT340_33885 [Streptosporangium sp. NPDC000239]|uniref:spermine/spermidine synthase domain-containing protein n=1 Tax=Streptosporangium sp. NPDC000239 TaxID=3154248 RepID=UPI003319F4B9